MPDMITLENGQKQTIQEMLGSIERYEGLGGKGLKKEELSHSHSRAFP